MKSIVRYISIPIIFVFQMIDCFMKKSVLYFMINFLMILFLTISCTDKKEAARNEINSGLSEMYQSNDEEAQQHFKKAIKWDESNPEPYLYLGRLALNDAKIDQALKYVDKAIELNPKFGEAYRTMAQINTIKGEKDKACLNYKKAKKFGIHNLDNYLKFCK